MCQSIHAHALACCAHPHRPHTHTQSHTTYAEQDSPTQAALLQTQTHHALSPIERLPEEILLIILRRLGVADRTRVARCSKSLRVVASISLHRHPGVLDARCADHKFTPLRRRLCILVLIVGDIRHPSHSPMMASRCGIVRLAYDVSDCASLADCAQYIPCCRGQKQKHTKLGFFRSIIHFVDALFCIFFLGSSPRHHHHYSQLDRYRNLVPFLQVGQKPADGSGFQYDASRGVDE